jgi:hypothetical protein
VACSSPAWVIAFAEKPVDAGLDAAWANSFSADGAAWDEAEGYLELLAA